MTSLDIAPVHEQTVSADRRARIWSAMTVIAFIVAAGLIAEALDIPNFVQAGLATEPPKVGAAGAERSGALRGVEHSGTWRLYELVY